MVRLDHIVQAHLRATGADNASLKVAQRRVRSGDFALDGCVTREPKLQLVPGVEAVTLAGGGSMQCGVPHAFYLMNKPAGVVCQHHPRESNVYDLIPSSDRREDLACVGRLDKDTTGTLLFGTDGGLQSMLLFPTSRVWKVYAAECSGTLRSDASDSFKAGLVLEDGTRCAPATLDVLSSIPSDGNASCHVRVTLHEGFFHQVKRMLAHCGATVVRLHRERFGLLSADDLQPGAMRPLSHAERASLVKMLPVDRVCAREVAEGVRRRARPDSEERDCEGEPQPKVRAVDASLPPPQAPGSRHEGPAPSSDGDARTDATRTKPRPHAHRSCLAEESAHSTAL